MVSTALGGKDSCRIIREAEPHSVQDSDSEIHWDTLSCGSVTLRARKLVIKTSIKIILHVSLSKTKENVGIKFYYAKVSPIASPQSCQSQLVALCNKSGIASSLFIHTIFIWLVWFQHTKGSPEKLCPFAPATGFVPANHQRMADLQATDNCKLL